MFLWAMACFAVGALVGFLFGLPKACAAHDDPDAEVITNTNLEKVSDWLTALIVALGLVQLAKIPGFLRDAASYLTSGQAPPAQDLAPFAMGLIVYFTVVGFLFGYLSTRLVVQPVLSHATHWFQATTARVKFLESIGMIRGELVQYLLMEDLSAQPSALLPGHRAQPAVEMQHVGMSQLAELAQQFDAAPVGVHGDITRDNKYAAKMLYIILKYNIAKDELLARTDGDAAEGWTLALVVRVLMSSEQQDVDHLLGVAPKASKEYVRYRIVLAFGEFVRSAFTSSGQEGQMCRIMQDYQAGAHQAFKDLMDETRASMTPMKTRA
jgi:hypothetical protein